MSELTRGIADCACEEHDHTPKFIVLTGGPGAGKTAVLGLATQYFCRHVAVLPESASLVFGGGFPRHDTRPGRYAAQRAIWHIQTELENLVQGERKVSVALCDRGTVDGLAYWPGNPDGLLQDLRTTMHAELRRYQAVIHLQTPGPDGFDQSNPLRIENAEDAAELDRKTAAVWRSHPHRHFIRAEVDFDQKAAIALRIIRNHLSACCQRHQLAPS